MRNALRYFSLLCLAAVLIALPSLALAVGNGTSAADPGFLGKLVGVLVTGDATMETGGIVAALLGLAAFIVPFTKWFPGWALKLNVAAGVLTAVAMAIQELGPRAGLLLIVLSGVGAVLGYQWSERRAEGKSVLST